MNDSNLFDLSCRPKTYFAAELPPIRSEEQERLRTQILAMLEDGDVAHLARLEGEAMDSFLDLLRTERLSEQKRRTAGMIHPAFMGGQYLPPLQDEEVEIAQIHLDSVTQDVISVYARQRRTRIVYKVVDEYEGDFEYDWRPKWSTKPLTMAQMVQLIEGIDLIGESDRSGKGYIRYTRDSRVENGEDPIEVLGFITVTSEIYPQLFAYFEAQEAEWFREVTANK